MPSVRTKAGQPRPVTGTYNYDKCHGHRLGEAGAIATRCNTVPSVRNRSSGRAYFVPSETPVATDESSRS